MMRSSLESIKRRGAPHQMSFLFFLCPALFLLNSAFCQDRANDRGGESLRAASGTARGIRSSVTCAMNPRDCF